MSDRPAFTVNLLPKFQRQVKADQIARAAVHLSRDFRAGEPPLAEADRAAFDSLPFDTQQSLVTAAQAIRWSAFYSGGRTEFVPLPGRRLLVEPFGL